ncbi:LrgB family protein [Paenibacillus mucilaginosus]|uniref:LrgB family protein n=3 Tax=Paenibacillus mucilaginosus TaxID=61624 RepID=H6ND60_9BACL|nr:LrgB family protein [Paenibacillus mucilaginosus]AEI41483.1 LrgB family protein [Paenibacillus mucilaginosus KNP414]AFC30021.1 LrgB family protein [Paenibacillus mucilaginosus 3016]AFH62208.1 LrgB [Paenibacillus mucilaginosus K02]MCG7215476.1 LrgB family protein [Paenibacillus mucilaginosus]WDM30495.1 LrgB family protein [Paenibacillus mucilaginosus]
MSIREFAEQPLFGIAVTILSYALALGLQRRWKALHPLLTCSVLIMLVLYGLRLPYEVYRQGGEYILFLLGPATVALGVPLYKHAQRIGQNVLPILSGVTAGSVAALLLAAGLVWALGGSRELLISMMPKSVTSPVAIEVSRQAGGFPELTAVLTVLTGLTGSLFGPAFLRLGGVRDDIAVGTAIGTSSHGIGTARIIRDSELAGSVSGFAMGAAAIITSLLFIPLYAWLQ